MSAVELSNEQRRQLIDATQAFEAWRYSAQEFAHSYRGSMLWKKVGGHEYLYRKQGSVWQSLGPRSAETEDIKTAYVEARTRLRQRVTRQRARLASMAPVNRALRLGRMPTTPARVLRKLDEVGLLGRQLIVVGTHSMFAYEVRSGVLFDSDLTATTDIDLLVDARAGMSLAVAENVRPEGVIGLLRKVDKSFARERAYRATNDDGYFVDIIAPMRADEIKATDIKIGEASDELVAASIIGLQWLMNAPRFEAVVIGEDGLPVWMPCIDPRAFALHKFWMSKRLDRDPVKRKRDVAQAKAIYDVAVEYLNLSFKARELSALPLELTRLAKDLVSSLAKKPLRKASKT